LNSVLNRHDAKGAKKAFWEPPRRQDAKKIFEEGFWFFSLIILGVLAPWRFKIFFARRLGG